MITGISVFIPNRNHGKYLGRCLDSICTQSQLPLEVYVLDDNSEDNSCLIVLDKKAQYADKVNINLVHYEEKSQDWMLSLHEHYNLSKGDYIHSMSADDFLLPDFYRESTNSLSNWSTLPGIVMSDWFAVDVNGRSRGIASSMLPKKKWSFFRDDMLMDQLCKPSFYEGGPSVLVRKDELLWLHLQEFHKLGSWNDSVGYSLVAWRKGAVYLPNPGGCFTLHDDGSGFNDQEKNDEEKAFAKFKAVWQFLHRPEVVESCPHKLRTALANKVFRTLSRANQDKWDAEWQELCYASSQVFTESVRCNRS